MFVSGVHPVADLNTTFCMICSLLMLIEDARGAYKGGILQSHAHYCLVGSHECLVLFNPVLLR